MKQHIGIVPAIKLLGKIYKQHEARENLLFYMSVKKGLGATVLKIK
jgi:hypothetical protein